MNITDSNNTSGSPATDSLVVRFVRDTRGANLVEYIMLVGLIAILCIVAFRQFGDVVEKKIGQEKSAIDAINATTGGGG
ncbi:MAG: Flp/Fap pilin component [Labilithrix sp.]|nr:Flp/Fap pilin component [Labilithrix sp.]